MLDPPGIDEDLVTTRFFQDPPGAIGRDQPHQRRIRHGILYDASDDLVSAELGADSPPNEYRPSVNSSRGHAYSFMFATHCGG